MSGKKKLERATRAKRVVATPTKKVKRYATDNNGNVVFDKNGKAVEEEVQLYRIAPLN